MYRPYPRVHEAQGELLVLHVGRVQRELHLHLHEEFQHDVAAGLRGGGIAELVRCLSEGVIRGLPYMTSH